MAKQIVKVKKDELEHILQTQEVVGYFYWDYWEFCSGHFEPLKTYPAGTLSTDNLQSELNELYEQSLKQFEEYKKKIHPCVTQGIYIGYFDDVEEDFHVIGSRWPEDDA